MTAQERRLLGTAALACLLCLASCGPRPDDPVPLALPGTQKSVPGDAAQIFDEASLHTADIRIDEGAWKRVLSDWRPEALNAPEYRIAATVTIDGQSMANVGIRTRANMLNAVYRRPLKLKFDASEPLAGGKAPGLAPRADFRAYEDRDFMGIQTLNLRASGNDPSLVRELLAYKLFRQAGVPAPRASLALVSVNGEPQGIYTLAEEIGKRFLRSWFEDPSGSLYKTGYEEGQGASFRPGSYGEYRYSKESGKGGAKDLVEFMEALGKVRSGAELEALMDKRNILAYMAICSVTGHWDSLMGNLNNDYVYRDPATGKWSVIVWDADNTFGSDWIQDLRCLEAPIDTLAPTEDREALFISLARKYWASEYRELLTALLGKLGAGKSLVAETRRLRDMVRGIVRTEDPWLLDYTGFLQSFERKPFVPPFTGINIIQYFGNTGLSSFIEERLAVMNDALAWQ